MDVLTETGALHLEHVMGTTVTLDLRDQHLTRPELSRAILAGVDALHQADRMFSTYRPDSAVSRLRRGTHRPEDCPPEVATVLVRCAAATQLTRGWFDPAAMPGGFDPTGLVKGWAAQRALREMTRWGVRNAVVNAGGDVAVLGDASGTADGSGWLIGIQDPFKPSGLIATVRSHGLCSATSGAYERGSLAIDPLTGRTVHRLASATVLAPDLAEADACSTAAAAQGPDALDWLAGASGVEALLVTLDGELLTTPGWPGVRPSAG